MSDFMSYDPWANVTTRNGLPGDEMISMLQKSIRRGLETNAIMAAYEMYITSQQFEDKLWRRLLTISVEDIGFGDLMAPVIVNSLNQMRKEFPYNEGDRPLFFVHAIRYLCSCTKDRSSDIVKGMLRRDFARGKIPEVPEYALDMHTARGRAMGRDMQNFLTEASRVEPQLENEAFKKLHEQFLEMVKNEDKETGKPDVQPFEYNTYQY